ncbi:FlgK family flagellar hook-associated protein [Buchnera aphidicola]|uniref:Flagellar hook-associated protein 1 n=1 Tax=Buchnera aphidicola (Artemisaphis artemisicola) TaxID=1241836 RepID=A0A4D6XT94_9GAMM|nr:flagellar hook protein [Buchnera aphidicola]QCI16015.1 flagellar hook protein [Buchnera aphidicola (Artemisaphis artemisicola)]
MGSILETAISGINAMMILIDKNNKKINKTPSKNAEKRVFLENTVQESNVNTVVKVKEIYDNYNDFIVEEKRKTNAQVKNEQTRVEQLFKLEDLLCEKSNIFNNLMSDLYLQIDKDILVDKKNIFNERIKAKLSNIMFSLKDFDRKLNFLEKDIKELVINNLQKVNDLINEIHDINININYIPMFKVPNRMENLIEKRENLVDELNDLIGVKVVKKDNNYQVFLNNGIALIDNNQKQNLIPLTSESDDRYISIGYVDERERTIKKIENMIPGAYLGALLKFKRVELANTRNKIGQLAVNFADNLNSHHILGHDMFGHVGKQIFNISNPEIIASSSNRSDPTISVQWRSISDAKDTDYLLYFKNNNWIVTRLADRTVIQPSIREDNNKTLINFDGIEFTITGYNADNNIFMIKPYSQTLNKLELLIEENEPFSFFSTNDVKNFSKHHAITIDKFRKEFLVNHEDTLDEAYQKFSKSIAYKANELEEEIPFKKNMIRILHDKTLSMSKDAEKDYQDINYQQECYLANVKVLEMAGKIFNEIIDCYS